MSDVFEGGQAMPEPPVRHDSTATPQSGPVPQLFAPAPEEESRRGLLVGGGVALLLVLVVAFFVLRGGRAGQTAVNAVLPLDAYASRLVLSNVAMSESTSLSGGKSTFIDGELKNTGSQTITGITVQVLFHNEEGLSPQVETLPLSLIRTHEPYIDTVPVSAAPLKPGDQREFRLIFETIPENWNQQTPELHVIKTSN